MSCASPMVAPTSSMRRGPVRRSGRVLEMRRGLAAKLAGSAHQGDPPARRVASRAKACAGRVATDARCALDEESAARRCAERTRGDGREEHEDGHCRSVSTGTTTVRPRPAGGLCTHPYTIHDTNDCILFLLLYTTKTNTSDIADMQARCIILAPLAPLAALALLVV